MRFPPDNMPPKVFPFMQSIVRLDICITYCHIYMINEYLDLVLPKMFEDHISIHKFMSPIHGGSSLEAQYPRVNLLEGSWYPELVCLSR